MTHAPIEDVDFSAEMHDRFKQFGTYANMTRGVPHVLDGQKPVQRRIMWAMYEMGAVPGKVKYKSMDCIGQISRYHPHGDSAIYDTMTVMAHVPSEGAPFKRAVPLIEGQGSWGDLYNKGAAAARYTECSLSDASLLMLGHAPDIVGGSPEIRENAVELVPNYSGRYQEPSLLPALLPAYVVNGAKGIGVGVAMDAPSHNLTEVMNLAIRMVDNPRPRMETVLSIMPGPDMPCEAEIYDGDEGWNIESYYTTGRGAFYMRAKMTLEEYQVSARKKGRRWVVDTLPYQVAPEHVVEGVSNMIANGDLPPDLEVANYSNMQGIRVVIDIKENDAEDVRQRLLYYGSRSYLQTSFTVNSNAIVDDKIQTIGVLDAIRHWIDHRRVVVRRRSRYRLERAQDRMEIVVGFIRAIPIADKIVELVRGSDNRGHAREQLQTSQWGFTERQAEAILDMTLSQLTKLSADRYLDEQADLQAIIDECQELLSDAAALDKRIKREMRMVRDQYGYDRRCELVAGDYRVPKPETPAVEVPAVNGFLVRTGKNWVRWASRSSVSMVVGNDYVIAKDRITDQNRFEAISNMGWHYRISCDDLPERMVKADSLFNLDPGEHLVLAGSAAPLEGYPDLILLAQNEVGDNLIKRIEWDTWGSLRERKSRPVINLPEGYAVTHSMFLEEGKQIGLLSAYGQLLAMDADALTPKGNGAGGNPGMRLQGEDDSIVWMGAIADSDELVYWTNEEQVGWFSMQDIATGSRNTKGQKITRSNNYVRGAALGTGDQLMWFDGTEDEPASLVLTGQSSGPALSDRQLKLVAPRILRANAVWLETADI